MRLTVSSYAFRAIYRLFIELKLFPFEVHAPLEPQLTNEKLAKEEAVNKDCTGKRKIGEVRMARFHCAQFGSSNVDFLLSSVHVI